MLAAGIILFLAYVLPAVIATMGMSKIKATLSRGERIELWLFFYAMSFALFCVGWFIVWDMSSENV